MARKTNKPASSKADDDLSTIIADPQATAARYWSAVMFAGVSVVVAVIATWFWRAVGRDVDGNSVIPLLATIGLYAASAGGIVSGVLVLLRRPVAERVLQIAVLVGFVCGINLVVSVVMHAIRRGDGVAQGLREVLESFVNFNRIEIGGVGISITGTVTIIVIVAAIAAAARKKK